MSTFFLTRVEREALNRSTNQSKNESAVLAIAATRDGNAGSGHAHGDRDGRKGRIVARRCGTGQTSSLRATTTITTTERTGAFATRGDVDFQALGHERIDTALDVRCIDILAIAEQATFWLATRDGATTFELRKTAEIAIHVDVGRARTIATRNAMILTGVRAHHGHVAAIFTVTLAGCFRSRYAIVGRRFRGFAALRGGLIAFRMASDHAIERRRIAFRKAARAAIARAHRRGRGRATTFATGNEIERFALACAPSFDFDFATKTLGIKIEVATFSGRRDRKR